MRKLSPRLGPLAALLLVLLWAGGATAQDAFLVENSADDGAGSLRQAILDANASTESIRTITFTGDVLAPITLLSALPTLDVGTSTLTIDGSAAGTAVVDGDDQFRIFFAESGEITILEVTIQDGLAQGGAGGAGGGGSGGGGGGLGAGGGLFVDEDAEVTLIAVEFRNNSAAGGDGGAANGGGAASAGGGGGGLVGNGGAGDGGGGGGGGFVDDPQTDDTRGDGSDGTPGAVLGSGGSGGGINNGLTPGGVGGSAGSQPSPAFPFGGGGGAGPTVILGVGGGDGGVLGGGGGGTGDGEGGDGGFGGGGGGTGSGTAGTAGFGGGDGGGGATGGGGGDGFGGSIFVREGGVLLIQNTTIFDSDPGTTNATAGMGAGGGDDGTAGGGALYLMETVQVTVDVPTAGENAQIQNSISGDGSLQKTGDGSLTLTSADNDYTGGTTVDGGRLIGSGAASIQGDVTLGAGTVLEVNEAASADLTASIGGTGSFQKGGPGTVILNPTGGNTWTGGTAVLTGTLQSSAGALPGSGTVTVQSNLILDEPDAADDHTWSGDLASAQPDAGTFRKIGPGTSRLTGTNSFTGTFAIEEGTLRGNVDGLPAADTAARAITLSAGATLAFDQASDAAFDGLIVGDGTLEKAGGGTLTLSAANSAYDGDTVVNAGALRVTGTIGAGGGAAPNASVNGGSLILDGDGSLYANATVAAGARLSGDANAGAGLFGNLVMNGTLAPGNSVGTVRVDGDVSFGASSLYEVEYDLSADAADLLAVTGNAALAGDVAVLLTGTGGGSTVTILTSAPNGVSGCFNDPLNPPGFFTFVLTCGSDRVDLEVDFDTTALFTDFVNTRNQTAVATALDPPPDPDVADFSDPWNTARFELTKITGQLPAATDELGGEALTAFTTAQLANAQEVGRVVSGRMRQVGGRSVGSPGTVDFLISGSRTTPGSRLADLGGAMLASNEADHALALAAAGPAFGAMAPGEGRRFGFWVDGYGVKGNLDGTSNTSATDWWSAGALVGFDLALGDHGLLGLTGGWSRIDADLDDRSLDGEADVYQGGLYGSYVSERLYVGGLARYAYTSFDTSRSLSFSGTTLSGRATGDYSGNDVGGFVELGYAAFAPAGVQIEPMVAGHFNWLSRESFTESGSDAQIDALSLEVEKESWTSIVSAVGVRLHSQWQLDRDLVIQPEVWGAWAHEFGDRDRPLNARFKGAAAGTGRFRVLGATAARDGGQFGAGWSVSRSDVSFFFYYDGNANADLVAHGLTAGMLVRW